MKSTILTIWEYNSAALSILTLLCNYAATTHPQHFLIFPNSNSEPSPFPSNQPLAITTLLPD